MSFRMSAEPLQESAAVVLPICVGGGRRLIMAGARLGAEPLQQRHEADDLFESLEAWRCSFCIAPSDYRERAGEVIASRKVRFRRSLRITPESDRHAPARLHGGIRAISRERGSTSRGTSVQWATGGLTLWNDRPTGRL